MAKNIAIRCHNEEICYGFKRIDQEVHLITNMDEVFKKDMKNFYLTTEYYEYRNTMLTILEGKLYRPNFGANGQFFIANYHDPVASLSAKSFYRDHNHWNYGSDIVKGIFEMFNCALNVIVNTNAGYAVGNNCLLSNDPHTGFNVKCTNWNKPFLIKHNNEIYYNLALSSETDKPNYKYSQIKIELPNNNK
ncbi:hypothetical protein SNEBB_000207 [Seison nebaliae]|nr:hypothetical protein SNEBB_000207 [Seison nebaliae]